MDLKISADQPTDDERDAIDTHLGDPQSSWRGAVRTADDRHVARGAGTRVQRHQLLPALHAVNDRVGWISRGLYANHNIFNYIDTDQFKSYQTYRPIPLPVATDTNYKPEYWRTHGVRIDSSYTHFTNVYQDTLIGYTSEATEGGTGEVGIGVKVGVMESLLGRRWSPASTLIRAATGERGR